MATEPCCPVRRSESSSTIASFKVVPALATVKDDDDDDSPSATSDGLHFGYGGVSVGYVFRPASKLHYLVDVLFAGGSVRPDAGSVAGADGDRVFVLKPSIDAEVNVSRHVRAAAGIGYRSVSGVDTAGLSDSDFGGFAARLVLKAGRF